MRQFQEIINEAIAELPASAQRYLHNVVVDVEEEPDEQLLRDQGFSEEEIAEGATLYGLFAPLRGFSWDLEDPHRIIIFKRPLEEDFPDRQELRNEIRKTVLHELHHHFGYSERDLDPFESKDDPFGNEV